MDSQLDLDEISTLYARGNSARTIALLKNTTHTRILRLLRINDIKRRTYIEAAASQIRINICIICGASFKPTGKLDRTTCNSHCNKILRSQVAIGTHMKNGASQPRYQRIARTLKEQKCEACGKLDIRLDVHHVDKNKANNEITNLKILCVSCHAKHHYLSGDTRIRGAP